MRPFHINAELRIPRFLSGHVPNYELMLRTEVLQHEVSYYNNIPSEVEGYLHS